MSTSETGYEVDISTAGVSSSLIDNESQEEIRTFDIPVGSMTVPKESAGYGYGFSVDGGRNYYAIPDPSENGVPIYSSDAVGESQFEISFGINTDPDTPNGTYENEIIFTAIANIDGRCPAGNICYNGNNDDGFGSMQNQEMTRGSATKLTPSNYSRPGYGFVGWNTMPDGTGTDYGPEETVNFDYPEITGITLYAKWIEPVGLMQYWNGCSTMAVGDVTALTDFRDNEVYTVAKLADGNCWTVENSRLNPSTAIISKSNTNNPTDSFVQDVKNSRPIGNQFCASDSASCVNQILYNVGNMNRSYTPAPSGNGPYLSWYSYGTFFNWYSATAGNGTSSTVSATVAGDICPAGWKLPSGGTGGDWETFNRLVNNGKTNNDVSLRTYPVNMIYAGDFNTDTTSGRGTQSRYWSATASRESNKVYRFGYSATEVSPSKSYNKWVAFPIRCIVKDNSSAQLYGNIHYNANGGSGSMSDETNVNLYTTSAKANAFSPPGDSNFKYWNTKSDGSGTTVFDKDMVAYAAEQEHITSGGTLTLYAFWGRISTLSFDANGGRDAPAALSEYEGADGTWNFRIPNQVPLYDDYTFNGWSTDKTATVGTYYPGDTVSTTQSSLKLYAIWTQAKCEPKRICYRKNNATSGASYSDAVSSNTTFNLTSPNYARNGYGFASWNTEADGTGTDYGPNEAISVGNVETEGISLYPRWVKSTGDLQNWQGCGALTEGEVIALRDTRDNNVYTITKHGDNHCWFMENLRLNLKTVTIDSNNTNAPTADFITKLAGTDSTNTMCNTNDSACIDTVVYNSNNINRSLLAAPRDNIVGRSWYSYGMVYNWYTATAGNGTYSVASGNVSGDICPAGWRLPTSSSTGEFMTLNQIVNNGATRSATGLLKYPVNIIFSGDFNTNIPGGRGTYTRLWSSTANSNANAYRFGAQPNNITPANNWNKWVAFPVRCIAKQ